MAARRTPSPEPPEEPGQAKARAVAKNAREEREETWRFKRAQNQARLERETDRARQFRLRAEKAQRDLDNARLLARERVEDAEKAVQDRRDRGATAEMAARARLREAVERREQAEAECSRRVSEAQQLLEQEKEHTAEVEALLERERRCSAARWEQVAAAEEQSRARLIARDGEADAEFVKAQEREAVALAALEAREREVQQRCGEEVQAARARLAKVKETCRERVDLEAARKNRAEELAQARLGAASARLQTEEACARQALASRRQDCESLVSRAHAREEVDTTEMEAGVAQIWEAAAAKSAAAKQREAHSKASLQSSVFVLGAHYASGREYRASVDEKVSKILQGCLHGTTPGSSSPRPGQPSMRALPPPEAMAGP